MKLFTALSALCCMLMFAGGMVPEEYIMRIDPVSPVPVRIAALLPFSGREKQTAERLYEGLDFAAAEINAGRGINNKPFEFKKFDTRGSVSGAVEAVRQAAAWGACAVIAGIDTAEVRAIIPHAVKNRMIVLLPATSDDKVREVSPFVYRVCYSDTQQAEALMAYTYYWRQAKTISVIIDPCEKGDYNRNLAAAVSKAMKQFGGTVINTTMLPVKGTLADSDLAGAVQGMPDVIFVAAENKRAIAILKRLRANGYRGFVCGPDNWNNDEFFSELKNFSSGECFFPALASERSEYDEYRKFCRAFRKKLYYMPGMYECQAYDALKFLAQSLNGIRDLEAFDLNWRAIRNHCGAATLYTMKPGGELDRMIYINGIGVQSSSDGTKTFVPRELHKLLHSKIQEYSDNYFNVR